MQTGAKCFKQVHMVTVARHVVVVSEQRKGSFGKTQVLGNRRADEEPKKIDADQIVDAIFIPGRKRDK